MVIVQTGAGAVVGGAVGSVGTGKGEAVGVGEGVGAGTRVGAKPLADDVLGGIVGTVVGDAGNVLFGGPCAEAFLLEPGVFEWLDDNATAATDTAPTRRAENVPTTSPRFDVARRFVADCSISGVSSTQPAPFHCLRPDHLTPSQKAWSFGFDPVEYQPGALSLATIKRMLDGKLAGVPRAD
jgi:hypothetical protein